MDRNRSSHHHRDEVHGKGSRKGKQNPNTDAVFLIQNENDVLRMKNTEINVKIKQLKLQVQMYSDNIALHQSDIQNIRNGIKATTYQEDIQIENQKKLLTQKLTLLKSNQDILLRKIKEARQATIFEQQKVAAIQNDRKGIQMQILSFKAQNEGTKIILKNLQEQNEKLRLQNELLISKRKIYQPKQKEISYEIQQRINFIKNQQKILKQLKKKQTTKLLTSTLHLIYLNKIRKHFSKIQRFCLLKKIAQKKLVQLSLIRKKYLMRIKHQILDKFRCKFNPLVEQETAKRIIWETTKRRVKAFIWRKWRTATKNALFSTTRRLQFQNTLDKITQAFTTTNLQSAFNMIKYFRNNPYHQRSCMVIDNVHKNMTKRCMIQFYSSLRSAGLKQEIDEEIQASSKQQTELLVSSLYFTAWAKLAKAHGIQNLSIKRRYFKELKKLLALRKRRKLGEILNNTNQRINNVDTLSKSFIEMKKQAVIGKRESLNEEEKNFREKKQNLQEQLVDMHSQKKALYQELALLNISKYLKKKMQKAFGIWRLRRQQSKVILTIINLVESKKAFDKNFGFAKILKKRFAMLKKSINDKIQSCEYSYQYLLKQNKHIKEVLDAKEHQLQKSKFMNILQKINRNQKEIKLKYFYKFMKNGYKYWKFRKVCHKIDQMTQKKIKMVFMWLLKKDHLIQKQQNRIQTFVEGKQAIINNKLKHKGFNGFKKCLQRNKNIKRIMNNIFSRNLQLDFYVAFGKIRNQEHIHYRGVIQEQMKELQGQIDKINANTAEQEKKIQTLKERLEYKQDTLVQRKILGLYNFFVRNIKKKFGSYIQLWRKRVKRQNRVLQFAQILERKSRVMLKGRFMQYINKKNDDLNLTQLQQKYKKFQNEYENMASNQQKFLNQHENQITKMKKENQMFKSQGDIYEKKTNFMVNSKLKSHAVAFGKKMLKWCFKAWKEQNEIFCQTWGRVNQKLELREKREVFQSFAKDIKEEIFKARIRNNLEKIYVKTYRFNAGVGFRIWRYVYLQRWIKAWTDQELKQMKRFEGLEAKYKYAVSRHDNQVTYRQYDPKTRALWNRWRQYTQRKIYNNINKVKINTWLFRGYSSQFMFLLKRRVIKKIQLKNRLNKFKRKWQQIRIRAFMDYTRQNKFRRKSVVRLFCHKFAPFMIHKTQEECLHLIKNYGHNQDVLKKQDKTNRIQTVIQTFQKKRRAILSANMVLWRRNQYQINIRRNLLRRITRNAMNWRVKDSFFSWKLQTQAKRVKQMHQEEGQVKKRKIQINRLKLFLEDFKKQKGLLLEDDGGKFVLSPRFQDKKDQQVKKDNNLRYRFISRLILSMNGYAAPVKAWNNLKTYMLVRQKYRKYAKFTKNNLRRPDLYYAFKIWHKASVDFNNLFDTMQRKGLIKILNKQKDKMQMEYSKKVNLQEKIQDEMRMHKLLSHNEDKKQKLAAHLLLKNVRKIKMYAMLTWRQRVRQSKQAQLQHLQEEGSNKIAYLQDEITQMEQSQRQLRMNNNKLESAVRQAVQIAQLVKRITQQRDQLSQLILNKQMTCESLQEENQELNAKLYQAQKQAMNLLILSGEKL